MNLMIPLGPQLFLLPSQHQSRDLSLFISGCQTDSGVSEMWKHLLLMRELLLGGGGASENLLIHSSYSDPQPYS